MVRKVWNIFWSYVDTMFTNIGLWVVNAQWHRDFILVNFWLHSVIPSLPWLIYQTLLHLKSENEGEVQNNSCDHSSTEPISLLPLKNVIKHAW